MPSSLRRACVLRAALTTAVLALPLLGAASAQAAIAGANPVTSTTAPDIRSANALDSADVQVCFDKPVSNTATASSFLLGGYRSDRQAPGQTVNLDRGNVNCVDVGFAGTGANAGDINQYTIVTVKANAVTANTSGGTANLADSVALTSSTTNNGTTNHTTAPDLTGVALAPSTSSNSLVYVFEQGVSQAVPADFYYADQSGNICTATAATPTGNNSTTVVAMFPTTCGAPGSASSVNNAVVGGVFKGGVGAAADPASTNPLESRPISGSGSTTNPDLTSAVLSSDGSSVSYTFDKPVTVADPTDFQVALSDGTELRPAMGNAPVVNGNTVTVNYGTALSQQDEYAVVASVTSSSTVAGGAPVNGSPPANGAVKSTNSTATNQGFNIPASAPVGDNAGAFARGFTTGPDVFMVSFNKTSGVVTVNVDQRAIGSTTADFRLLSSNNTDQGPPSTVNIPMQGAGRQAVTLQFNPNQLSVATALQLISSNAGTGTSGSTPLGNCALNTSLTSTTDGLDACNVSQVVAPISTAAILRAVKSNEKAVKAHKTHKAHKATKHHQAHKHHRANKKH